MQRLFLIEAVKYTVLPLDDRRIERITPNLAGRPQLIRGKSQLLFGDMGRLSESSIVVLKNMSHSVTAQVVAPPTGVRRFKIEGHAPIPPGEHVDGDKVGEGRVDATVPLIFSADETADVGTDSATPVSDDYRTRDRAFNGRVRWIQIDVVDASQDLDHLITPERRLQVAVARQ
jgi:arylsulfatase